MSNPESQSAESTRSGQMVPAQVPAAYLRRATRRANTAASPAPSTGGGLTPAFFWQVFCKSWMWAIPAGIVLSAAAGAVVWWLHVPMYEAKALIKIEASAPYVAFEEGRGGSQDADRFVQTQIETIRSPIVLNPLLANAQIAKIAEIKSKVDPLHHLTEHLTIRQRGKSELFDVTFKSKSPNDAATVVSLLILEYLRLQNDEADRRTEMVIKALDVQRASRRSKVDELRREVVNLAKNLTGRDPFGQGVITDAVAYSPSAALSQELTQAEVELEVLKAEVDALNALQFAASDHAIASGLLDLEVANRPDVRLIESRLLEIEERIGVIKGRPRTKIGETWENDPEYLRLSELADTTRKELGALKVLARQELTALRLEHRKSEREAMQVAKAQELAMLTKRRDLLKQKLDDHIEELSAGGGQSAELEFKKSELAREQEVFEKISARQLALQIESKAPPRVSQQGQVSVPHAAIEPVPYKLLLISCLGSLLAPFGLAVGREAIVRRVRNGEQLAREIELPLLGEVSRLPTRRVDTRRQLLAPQQRELLIYTESIDSLRTTLALTEQVGIAGQTKIVAVCSAVSGEGKTNIATSLGMSISQASNRATLVIDADLRDPDVANYLDVPTKPGLAEVLAGKATISEAIYRVGETRTFVMPAGEGRANPHRVIEGNKVQELLATLRGKFGTILIDTPPVLAASEALVYAKAADLVVFCSLAEVSRAKQARIAADRLEATGANVAGAVISGVPQQQYVYRYGNYYVQSES